MSSPVNPYSACLQSFRQNLPNDYCWQGMDGRSRAPPPGTGGRVHGRGLVGVRWNRQPTAAIALTNSNETFGRNALTDHLAETSAAKCNPCQTTHNKGNRRACVSVE